MEPSRHLLPNEIDLLLDGDAGFGLTPLRAHVRQCEQCRAEVEAAQEVFALLGEMPHFAPEPGFAGRVMSQVQVFEPWHVTLRDSVLGLVPRSRPMRVLAGAGALVTALVVSAASIALLGRLDAVLFGWQLVAGRARDAMLGWAGQAAASVFGELGAATLARTGAAGIGVAIGAFLLSLVLAALALRALTVAYHRQRS